ncbi:hypothetical protein acsn021_36030 [Anaerocolumna cellulosilytica]|uniref:Uncharacterized protein n=1 Tax=Anaerocolumna cellulosilytica TaxID=433286 RepID=A0A6S6QZF3_9FIRM|nr:hypothetical protein [Anaerocolumna cellulosilytica]MBB5195501.1 putative transcriptional regulator [Anaerocolumna cellulosilytica]BCJ96034.1 hypothetical protein acsn021_36030 [Anaerocolumna cellulosilytica]
MITSNGTFIMEGLEKEDSKRLKNHKELTKLVNTIGFLPLFKSNVPGFSVEEQTDKNAWWTGKKSEDPWEWRALIADEGDIAYGKFFSGKAGFISKEWYPIFAAYRRDGYDFDSRYEDGLASRKAKNIIDILTEHKTLLSNEMKMMAGFGKGGEKGFDTVMSTLQMQTYITVRGFVRKKNKKNQEYGWPVAVYSLSEDLFGEEYVKSEYRLSAGEAKDKIVKQLQQYYPEASIDELRKCIK